MKTKTLSRNILAIAGVGALAFSLAACSGGDSMGNGNSSSDAPRPSSSAPMESEDSMMLENLSGVDSSIMLDMGFTDALMGLGVTPATVGDATMMDSSIMFPITGGELEYWEDEMKWEGSIEHMGSGLSLTAGDTMVELTDFKIDPAEGKIWGMVSANGEMMEDVELFDIDTSTMMAMTMGDNGEWIMEGGTVYLSEDAATMLNDTFGTDALMGGTDGGTMVGTATITASGDGMMME